MATVETFHLRVAAMDEKIKEYTDAMNTTMTRIFVHTLAFEAHSFRCHFIGWTKTREISKIVTDNTPWVYVLGKVREWEKALPILVKVW